MCRERLLVRQAGDADRGGGQFERAEFGVSHRRFKCVKLALFRVVEAVNCLLHQEVEKYVWLFCVHTATSLDIVAPPRPNISLTCSIPRRACVLTVPRGIPVASDISWCDIPWMID